MPIYVQHEVLGRIPDVFNAEAIWQAPGLSLFSRRPLLRDLLERCPREHKGRAATRCFSHVTLLLPQEDVDDDYHLTRGARARDLAQTLTALHQKDFGDLLGSDQVRYDVIGLPSLAPGEIEVKFGHAVYLPAPDEKILYNVSVSRDSAIWQPVCPIYPNQRLALIGGDDGSASFAAPGWPFGGDGAILIINDGPDSPPIVQMRPKDAFECRFDPRTGYYTIKSARGGIDETGATARLLLKVTRSASAPMPAPMPADPAPDIQLSVTRQAPKSAAATAPAVWQSRTGTPPTIPAQAHVLPSESLHHGIPHSSGAPANLAAQAAPVARAASVAHAVRPEQADLTALPMMPTRPANKPGESDATYAPLAQQRISLVALALPRLSRYRDTGAQALELPFNRSLSLSADGQSAISFSVNAADELHASTAAGRQRISAPSAFTPVDGRAIALLPAAPQMADRYCATLCLPQPVSAPVATGVRFTFGRSSPMLAALRLLDSPRFLQRADGASSADRIGLSRTAFSFEATPQGLKIGRLAATQALYHLDDKLAFVASIGEASAEAPYLLPVGHHLVAGHYVLRFDA